MEARPVRTLTHLQHAVAHSPEGGAAAIAVRRELPVATGKTLRQTGASVGLTAAMPAARRVGPGPVATAEA